MSPLQKGAKPATTRTSAAQVAEDVRNVETMDPVSTPHKKPPSGLENRRTRHCGVCRLTKEQFQRGNILSTTAHATSIGTMAISGLTPKTDRSKEPASQKRPTVTVADRVNPRISGNNIRASSLCADSLFTRGRGDCSVPMNESPQGLASCPKPAMAISERLIALCHITPYPSLIGPLLLTASFRAFSSESSIVVTAAGR